MNGTEVYSHGLEIALSFDRITIDFDYGDPGELDALDTWCLRPF